MDPGWVRRSTPPPRERSLLPLGLAVAALVLGGGWLVRTQLELRDSQRAAQAATEAAAASRAALVAQQLRAEQVARMWAARREELQRADRTAIAGADGASINGRQVHWCSYAGSTGFQTRPCESPWVEVSAPAPSPRRDEAYVQAEMIARAEAKLRLEQERFAALTGQTTTYNSGANVAQSSASRCQAAKAERDNAYRIVGNKRDFNFIRTWDDYVYNACK